MTRDEKIAVLNREFDHLDHLMMALVNMESAKLAQFEDCYYVLDAALRMAKDNLSDDLIASGEA